MLKTLPFVRHRSSLILIGAMSAILFSGCQSVRPGAATGGAFGTLAGSLAGASIGAREGKTAEGALIGALAGGTVGSLAGNAVDRQVERDRLLHQQAMNEQQFAAVDMNEVIRMSQSGLGSDVIARQIQAQGVVRRPTIDELIMLKNQGVDDLIIQAVQNAPIAGNTRAYSAQPPAVYYDRRPAFYESCAPYPFHHGGYYRRRARCGPSAGFSICID